MKATDVFTPGTFPSYTYVERERQAYETQLQNAIDIKGQVISLAGPSKSGKTVLVEQVVGKDDLLAITGAGIQNASDIWERVLDLMDAPTEITYTTTTEGRGSVTVEASGETGIPLLAKGSVTGGGSLEASRAQTQGTVRRRGGQAQVIREIGNSDFVILIDDFHYMPRSVQEDVARQIKAAIREGVKIVTISVPHRSDDVVRANSELRGRTSTLDLDYWHKDELKEIATKGFELMNVILPEAVYAEFVEEAAGSPQLMQTICLYTCFILGIRETLHEGRFFDIERGQIDNIFEAAATVTDFRTLVDVLDAGPRTRGTERKTFDFVDNTEGDVYRCILKAISLDPPRLSFTYDDINSRIRELCKGDTPSGSSVIGSCQHIAKLALDSAPTERIIDWDEQKFFLDIPDPYFLFYLRWSDRLLEPER